MRMTAATIDDHVHSSAGSADAVNSMEELCARAVEHRLARVCFTEHVDYDTTLAEYGYFDYDVVCHACQAMRQRYGDQLDVRLGLEVDFRPEFLPAMRQDLPRYDVDFVLGSVHCVGGRHLIEVRWDRATWTPEELAPLYAEYFHHTRLLIDTGSIDSLAHFDYPYKLGMRRDGDVIPGYDDELDATLALAAARGVGIEVNTKRADRDAPLAASEAILRRYRACGGDRVTIGSDAHRVDDLGCALAIGVAAIRAAGFTHLTTYRNRTPIQIPL
jgi:histidinol-phosphatase (PHP family)